MEMHDAVTADRFGGPTYYGNKQNSSTIDHIFVPTAVREHVLSCRVLWSQARKLQMIPSRTPRDHVPTLLRLT
eukprot:8492648-Pyramimonas_sp.AAC.1